MVAAGLFSDTHTVGPGEEATQPWSRRHTLFRLLCDSGKMIHLSGPQLPHLYRGEATGECSMK